MFGKALNTSQTYLSYLAFDSVELITWFALFHLGNQLVNLVPNEIICPILQGIEFHRAFQ